MTKSLQTKMQRLTWGNVWEAAYDKLLTKLVLPFDDPTHRLVKASTEHRVFRRVHDMVRQQNVEGDERLWREGDR